MLSINRLRPDGYHDLTSLVAPIDLSDELEMTLEDAAGEDSLHCNAEGVPADGSNLVLKAAARFRRHMEIRGRVSFTLRKNIPVGAGLGGGSSNAATALLLLNDACGRVLGADPLRQIASEIGSDCALFIEPEPALIRGRGERVQSLTPNARQALKGLRLLLFKPSFGISTPWAYGVMKAAGGSMYEPEEVSQRRLEAWFESPLDRSRLPLFNNMQLAAREKYPSIELILNRIKDRFGLQALMSGSGSSCFVLLPTSEDEALETALVQTIRDALGEAVFLKFCSIG